MKEKRMTTSCSLMTLRTFFVCVVIAVLAALLSGCGSKEAPITVPAGAQAGDLVGLEPCTYEARDVEYAADCGTLVVPENRADPNSRLIALPVIRVRATGGNPAEPIFYFMGGPGNSNLHFKYLEGLVEDHDFVQVGYRAADGSVVLDCPEVTQAIEDIRDDLLSEESIANVGDAFTRCGARLRAEGVDLDGYTMLETIKDVEAARVALGYERINLLGQSYGTRVAMFYMWMYPESLHRVVMYAVNPPGGFVQEPGNIDGVIELDAELCAQDTDCSARTNDLAGTVRGVVQDMPDRWLFLPIDPGNVRVGALQQFYYRGSAAMMYDAFLAAERGDPSGLATASLMGDLVIPTAMNWGHATSMAVPADYDPARDYMTEMNPPGSILGSPIAELQWGAVQFMDWPQSPLPEEYRQLQPSDVETLLFSGSADPSNPAYLAERFLTFLSDGEHVVLSEFGHSTDFWKFQPEARIHMLTTFYETGEVDDSRYTYQPMDFSVGFLSFPRLAKLIVVVPVLVIVIVVALVWFIVRRVRRRRAGQVPS